MRNLGLVLLLLLGLGPAQAQQAVVVPATMFSAPINMSTATTTKMATGIAGKSLYVNNWNALVGGTTNLTWVTGTGTNCATNQTSLTGPYPMTAQVGAVVGVGYGTILVVPAAQDLCLTSSGAVQVSGSLAYAIF